MKYTLLNGPSPSFFGKHYHQNTIFSISEMSERNAGTYLIIWQVLGKKKRKTTFAPQPEGNMNMVIYKER